MITFAPTFGGGQTVAPGTSSAAITLAKNNKSVLLTNLGTETVYVRLSPAAVAATIADYPVLASSQVTISKAAGSLHVSYLTASGTGSLHVMGGEGA